MAGVNFAIAGRTQQGVANLANKTSNFTYPLGASFGIQPLSNASNLGQSLNVTKGAGDAVTQGTKGLDWWGNNGIIGSTGAALNGVANLWGAYNSFMQGNKQLKEMRRQNDLLEQQYKTEIERYNKREAERDASNSYFQNMANGIYQRYYSNYGNAGANIANANAENTLTLTNDNAQNALNQPQTPQIDEQKRQNVVERE